MRYRRLYTNGATYFFTLVIYNRNKIFSNPNNIKLLKESVSSVKNKFPFVIEAIVALPEHLHCLLTLPNDDCDFSTRLRLIKTEFSKKCDVEMPACAFNQSRKIKKEKHIWQRRFWEHQIRNEKDFNAHMDYIHYNPVKHGLACAPKDWPYSSFLNCVKRGLYYLNWGKNISDQHFDKIVNAE